MNNALLVAFVQFVDLAVSGVVLLTLLLLVASLVLALRGKPQSSSHLAA